jgi:two-component system, response regulator PdtaR
MFETTLNFAPALKRVLIVDPQPAGARLVADLIKGLGAGQIYTEGTTAEALAAAKLSDPQIIFTELAGPRLDGLRFTQELRRSHLSCRQAPVIMITAEATASAILAARNAGVHEFLRKPFTIRDLTRRLEAVTLKPRDWVEAVAYVGPDRRRFNSGDYKGPRKRKADAGEASNESKREQALKITCAAIAAIETDPAQALRSLAAQATELKALGAMMGDAALTAAAAKLQRALPESPQGFSRPTVEAAAADLWAFLDPEEEPTKAA